MEQVTHARSPHGNSPVRAITNSNVNYYIRQVNGVKLADIMFSLLSVCVSVCAHTAAVFHTEYINANCSNTVKDTDFKFHKHVPRDSLDMTPEKISKRGRGHGHVTP